MAYEDGKEKAGMAMYNNGMKPKMEDPKFIADLDIPDTKEEGINWIQNRINARSKQIDALVERIQQMQKANSRDLLKLDETRLLKDIRDGRVKLVHAETGREISVHVFNNPK